MGRVQNQGGTGVPTGPEGWVLEPEWALQHDHPLQPCPRASGARFAVMPPLSRSLGVPRYYPPVIPTLVYPPWYYPARPAPLPRRAPPCPGTTGHAHMTVLSTL